MTRRFTSLVVVGALAVSACGGSDDPETTPAAADLPASDAPADDSTIGDAATSGVAPDEPVDASDPGDPAVSGEAPETGAGGGAYSGGVVASSFDGICEILDANKVAELFSIEATAIVSSVNTGTGVCDYGDGGTVRLLVNRPDELGVDAPDFFRDTIGFLVADGLDVAEAEIDGISRATFIERGDAVVAFVLDPYYVEIRDTAGGDIAVTALVADVAAALR